MTTEKQLKTVITVLNSLVNKYGEGSSEHGLNVVATAFRALLDIYSAPNPNNPQGMCDDAVAFRRHYAEMVAACPTANTETNAPEDTQASGKQTEQPNCGHSPKRVLLIR
jgi:hypothetical protein